MHIIGIYINSGSPKVMKNLGKGWYPFGNYEMPNRENHYNWRSPNCYADSLYQTKDNYPQISISCIVGRNGSGKTTLLEVLYMILNNLSYCLLNSREKLSDAAYNEYAYGINATLYYEMDTTLYRVSIKSDKDEAVLCSYDAEQDDFITKDFPRTQEDIDCFLGDFFYTIGMNYSLYSMQFDDDYEYPKAKEITRQWLNLIFKNEEDYYFPISISPFRVGGQINMNSVKTVIAEQLSILFILQFAHHKSISNYRPVKIVYRIDKEYEKKAIDELNGLCVSRHIMYGIASEFVSQFKEAWQDTLNFLLRDDTQYEQIKELLLFYLAYNSIKLCLTYKSFGDLFGLSSMQELEDYGHNPSVNAFVKLGNYNSVVNKIKEGKGSVSAFYHQFESFLIKKMFQPLKGEIIIEDIIRDIEPNIIYDIVYAAMPPAFYRISLFLRKGDSDEIQLDQLSSGEKQFLYSNSALLTHIYRIANAERDTRIVPYKNINIIIDEVELYSHPEYQRRYIADFVDLLNDLQISRETIHSINLIIATHSPFLLSDVPNENIVRMDNGNVIKQEQHSEPKTFCSNIYELLANTFFMEYPMGECARNRLETIIDAYNNIDGIKKKRLLDNKDFYIYLKNIIGDTYFSKTISMMVDSILEEDKKDVDKLKKRKKILEYDLEKVNEQIRKLNETN